MAFTLNDFQNKASILSVHKTLEHYFQDTYSKSELNELFKSKRESANFWKRVFSHLSSHLQYVASKKDEKLDAETVTNYFSYDLIKYVFAYSNLSIGRAKEYFEEKYPYLELLQAIRVSTSQWNEDKLKGNKILEVFSVMEKLPQPFNDNRFKAIPIHTAAIQKGYDYSIWLKNEIGGFMPEDKGSRFSSSFRNNYLDSKYGILIFYNNKPSILVSFLIDNENNLYIQQIQSQIKDRGHYKLGKEWRNEVIHYIESIFPRHKTHIINGADSAKMSYDCYLDDVEESKKPNQDTLERIKLNYDKLRPTYTNNVVKFNLNYRTAA